MGGFPGKFEALISRYGKSPGMVPVLQADGTLELVAITALVGVVNPQPVPTFTDLSTWDIRTYCALGGDHFYTIPNGVYTAGDLLDAAHAATSGVFGGYLILQPQTLGGAIIDGSPPGTVVPNTGGLVANGNLTFNYNSTTDVTTGTTSGIILSGFLFRNGIFQCNAPNCHLWYPEFTFPYTVWQTEPGYPNTNYHRENGGLYHGFGADNCKVYGMNCHDAGTGPTIQQGAQRITYTGWTATNIDNGGNYDNVHPDALQMLGGQNSNITITDFDINCNGRGFGPNIQNAANNSVTAHDDTNIVFARGWVRNCPGAGMQLNSFNAPAVNPRIISGTLTDIHCWANGGPGHTSLASYQFIQAVQHATSFDQISYDINSYSEPTRISFVTTRCDTLVDASAGGAVASPYADWLAVPANGYGNVIPFMQAATGGWVMV